MADEELTFAEKIKTLHFATGVSRGTNVRREYKDDSGHMVRKTKDDATSRGNITIEHAKGDRQDVIVRPDVIRQQVTPEDHREAREAAKEIKFEAKKEQD